MPGIIPLIGRNLYQALSAKRLEMPGRPAYVFVPVADEHPSLLFVGQASKDKSSEHDDEFGVAVEHYSGILHWGLEQEARRYPFWRVVQAVSNQATRIAFGDEIGIAAVGWSNLVKISREDGNPNEAERAFQSELCIQALTVELGTAKAAVTIFLTGDYAQDDILYPAVGRDGWRNNVPEENLIAVKNHPQFGLLVWSYHPRSLSWTKNNDKLVNFIAGFAAAALLSVQSKRS